MNPEDIMLSEDTKGQYNMCHLYGVSKIVSFMEAESRPVVAKGKGNRKMQSC